MPAASRRLAIVGAGGHGRVAADIASLLGWQPIVFYDDRWPSHSSNANWAVAGTTAGCLRADQGADNVFVAIGDNGTRLKLVTEFTALGRSVVSLIHPSAVVSPSATIGVGSMICAGAVVGPFAVAGDATIVNTNASVDHDCLLGRGVHIGPAAALGGAVIVGDCSWVGIGATVNENLRIGSNSVVGARAAVVADVASDIVVIGVPAKPRGVEL